MELELAIIVLNYRTADMTIDCLRSLATQVGATMRVIVVDNESGDGSAQQIEQTIALEHWGWASVLRAPSNGGFATGNNLGIRSIESRAYMLLNSDTIVQPGAIRGLLDAMSLRPDAGIIGPGLLRSNGGPDQSCFRNISPLSELIRGAQTGVVSQLLRVHDPVVPITGMPMEVDWLGFACVLIRRDVFERIGLLDERYFMYFEDVDFCRRARAAGFTVLYYPEPKVTHFLGGSSQVTRESTATRRAPRYYYEARAKYFARFYGQSGLWAANSLWCVGHFAARCRGLLDGRTPRIRERELHDLWTTSWQTRKHPPVR